MERFWSKSRRGGPGECWVWTAALDDGGYGVFGMCHSKVISAHRFAYLLERGPIRDGLNVLHRCDNRPCVNPDHLFLGTQADNMRDMAQKGRGGKAKARGAQHWNARLTADDVRAIRAYPAGAMAREIAERFGVSRMTVIAIRNGRLWKCLD